MIASVHRAEPLHICRGSVSSHFTFVVNLVALKRACCGGGRLPAGWQSTDDAAAEGFLAVFIEMDAIVMEVTAQHTMVMPPKPHPTSTACFQQVIDSVYGSVVLVQPKTSEVWCTLSPCYLANNDLLHTKRTDQELWEIKEIPHNRLWCTPGVTEVITVDWQHDDRVTPQPQRSHPPDNLIHLPHSRPRVALHIHPPPIHTQPLVVHPPLKGIQPPYKTVSHHQIFAFLKSHHATCNAEWTRIFHAYRDYRSTRDCSMHKSTA